MPVQIIYCSKNDGTTVPYPSLFDDIRRNHGYVHIKGDPSAVHKVPEAQASQGLHALLTEFAQPECLLVSLGCDLGEHIDPNSRAESRCRAGGYVQIADARLRDTEGDFLKRSTAHLERELRNSAATDRWKIRFELRVVHYKFDELVKAHSVWVWFDAMATTFDKARESRERMLTSFARAVQHLPAISNSEAWL